MSEAKLPQFAENFLDTICEKIGYSDYSIQVEAGSQFGDGILSDLFSIKITENGKETLDVVAKLAPLNKNRSQGFFARDFFSTEIAFYDKVMPTLAKFQEEKNLPEEARFSSSPKCYGTLIDEENGHYVLILEDLRPQNFKMWNSAKPVPLENAKLTMRELGKLHGISIAMKHQRPDEFTEFKQMRDQFRKFVQSEAIVKMFENIFDRAIAVLKNESHQNIMLDIKNNLVASVDSCFNDNVTNRFGVICHGDCWNNNILYRFNDEGIAEDIRVLDWQKMRYVSPGVDLVYNLFTSTDSTLRDLEFDNLLNIYYESLSNMVRLLGSDPDELFTFKNLQDELKTCGIYALITGPMVIQISLATSSEMTNLNEVFDKTVDGGTIELTSELNKEAKNCYEQRLSEMIEDVLKRGYYRKVY